VKQRIKFLDTNKTTETFTVSGFERVSRRCW